MISTDLAFASATELAAALRRGDVSSRELVTHYLERIERLNPAVNAVVTLADDAIERADAADAALAAGTVRGPLHGLPITLKDTMETAGLRTTAGAPEYAEHVPERDADAVARLRAAGAVIVGKTNTPAYAGDAQTYNPIFGTTNNPWDPTRAVGGSSGGSAAAIAAGFSALELGSDLGGSIRGPAGHCGVYGLHPSVGIIPIRGHIPGPPGALHEIDSATVGPIARSAADLGLALDVLAGPDAARGVGWHLDLPRPRAHSLRDYRIAVWLDDELCPVDAEVLEVLGATVDAIRGAGAHVDDTARPGTLREAERLVQQLLQPLVSNAYPAAEYDRLRDLARSDDDTPQVRHARNVTATMRDHIGRLEERAQMRASCARFFTDFDVLLCPITPVTAIPHDHNPDVDARRIVVNGRERPYGDLNPWSSLPGVCGLPAAVVPAGLSGAGLPVGLQVIGPWLEDRTVIDVAARIAEVSGGFVRPPGF